MLKQNKKKKKSRLNYYIFLKVREKKINVSIILICKAKILHVISSRYTFMNR